MGNGFIKDAVMSYLRLALVLAFNLIMSACLWAKGDMAPSIADGSILKMKWGENSLWQGEGFAWIEKDKSLRIPKPAMKLKDMAIGETIVELEEGRPVKIIISIYNRGDMSPLDKDAFQEKIKTAKEILDEALGKSSPYKPVSSKTMVKIEGYSWKNEELACLLEYSFSRKGEFKGEFIRATIVPEKGASDLLVSNRGVGPQKGMDLKSIKNNVEKSEDGDVCINNVPMVDQGQKGYCAAATTARIVNYYGHEGIDQHQIAQVANTTADKGTDADVMLKGISRILPGRYGLRVKSDLYKEDIRDLLKKYNRAAAKAKQTQVTMEPRGGVIYVQDVWRKFNPDILLAAKTSNKAQVDRWAKLVANQIDQGIPVIWSVMLGLYPENKNLPQSFGGHMRIIIGYNLKTEEIIFTDSWGAGHEKKRIPLKSAFAMTTGMHVIIPQR